MNEEEEEKAPVVSPLTGTLTMIYAENGAEVEMGERILGIECMKMIHEVTAPFPGVVEHLFNLGDVVNQDDTVAFIKI